MLNRVSIVFGLDANYFVKGGFWLGLSTGLSLLGGIFLSALLARTWPADVYGQYSFLMSALGFISVTALPGMGQALTQASSEGRDGSYLKAARYVAQWSMLGVALLIFGSVYFYFRQNPDLALAIFVCAVAFPITSATSLSISFLTGKKKFRSVAIFNIILQYTSILATAFALWKMPSIVWVTFFSSWSTALTGIVLTLIAYKEIKNKMVDTKLETLGKNLSISQLFTIVADNFDKFLIPLMLGFTNNAVYAFAILIPMQIHTFLKVILSLAQPKIALMNKLQLHRDLTKKAVQLEILVLLIVVIYILSAPHVFKIMYPAYSETATQLSQIFSLTLLYYPTNLFGLALVKKRNTAAIKKVNIVYFIASILSLFVFIPLLGIWGAIISKVFSRITQSTILFYYYKTLS